MTGAGPVVVGPRRPRGVPCPAAVTSLLLAPLLLTLGACGGGASTSDDASGTSAAAADDEVVLALDDFAALALLTLGVEPDLTLTAFGYGSTEAIFQARGLETQEYGAELDVERVAVVDPDVIVGVSIPTTASLEPQLDTLAPTTVLDYTADWQTQLRAAGAAVGREDRAEEVIARVAADSDELAADLAASPRAGAVVSVLGDNPDFFSLPEASGPGSVLSAAGLGRPAAQKASTQADSPFVQVAEEALPDHDGDVLFLLAGGAYDTADLRASPLFGSLASAPEAVEVSGEVWLASSAFSTDWILRDLRATLLDGGDAAPTEDAAERFDEFISS